MKNDDIEKLENLADNLKEAISVLTSEVMELRSEKEDLREAFEQKDDEAFESEEGRISVEYELGMFLDACGLNRREWNLIKSRYDGAPDLLRKEILARALMS